jgi:predicted NUDIX family phosphoesterase
MTGRCFRRPTLGVKIGGRSRSSSTPRPKGIAVTAVAMERVLVVPTALFRELGYFQGFSTDVARYLPRLVEGREIEYLPRGRMEEDPTHKQLIPYVLFRWTDADNRVHLFQYQRGGGMGEQRLHAKRSVGVGGHISSVDAAAGRFEHVYREGMQRELSEEVAIKTPYLETIAGLINDDETPVGTVHLGVVHILDVEQPAVEPLEDDILDAGFRPVGEILGRIEEFESWSQIAVRALFG